MSIFDKLEVVVRYAVHPGNVSPLGRQPTDNACDIIDETGAPAFPDAGDANQDQVSVEFGARDVAVLLARDHGAGLIVVRVQVAEAMSAAAAQSLVKCRGVAQRRSAVEIARERGGGD